jgi:hypothetical protein
MSKATFEQVNGKGFRFYKYDRGDGSEPVHLLSVSSIRTLCGEQFNLVNWKMANLADAALGTQKRTVIGPRGGKSEKRQVWEYPSEFVRMYNETDGEQGKIDALRKWLRARADDPRNIAAVRGSITHACIERDIPWHKVERALVEHEFSLLSHSDRSDLGRSINDEDIFFVRNSMRHYWHMRAAHRFVIIARECRVMNLESGYAGTFDALVWMAPASYPADMPLPLPEVITPEFVAEVGGRIILLDWKTSGGIYTDQVLQAHAYLGAEAVMVDGLVEPRLTLLLNAATEGGLVHIRPDGWGLHLFQWTTLAMNAYLASVIFARFLAANPDPSALFSEEFKGKSEEEDA